VFGSYRSRRESTCISANGRLNECSYPLSVRCEVGELLLTSITESREHFSVDVFLVLENTNRSIRLVPPLKLEQTDRRVADTVVRWKRIHK
jgi:hypothetical protein